MNTGNGTAQNLQDMGDTMAWGNMTVLGLQGMGDIDDMREVTAGLGTRCPCRELAMALWGGVPWG